MCKEFRCGIAEYVMNHLFGCVMDFAVAHAYEIAGAEWIVVVLFDEVHLQILHFPHHVATYGVERKDDVFDALAFVNHVSCPSVKVPKVVFQFHVLGEKVVEQVVQGASAHGLQHVVHLYEEVAVFEYHRHHGV